MKCVSLFPGDDCFAGANFCAATAFDAGVGIDVIDVAFRDSLYGANGKTSSTSYTLVSDYVSHDKLNFRYYTIKELLYTAKVNIYLELA